ncbi:hypothetical protein BASA83_002912 [Batrachochytrium salamandrivorans]|nr:hypothetical protein BASA83_002912 [Batrachochytrium salamandrivorans]
MLLWQDKLHYILDTLSSSAGVEMDPKKIDAVQEWPVPTKVHDIKSSSDLPISIGVHSQRDLQPVAFFSRQMVPATELRDLDKELLAIAMVAGYPRTTPEHMSQGIGTFYNGRQHFCRVLENGLSKIPYCPSWDRKSVYTRFHRGLGHLKFDSIIDLVTRRYWWPTMKQDIKKYISECPECQLDQSASGRHAPTPIRPIPSVALPFERWGMDFVQDLPRTKSGNQHIITAIDYATRWVVAKAVPNRDSVTVASFLYELMMNYGSPFELFTDRGSSFISEGIREYEKLQRIRHHATTPYHPQTNGMVERMHATMGHAITTLTQGRPDRWDEYLQQTVLALRVRKHAVTKQSPFYLLYGVHPRLPGDDGPIKGNHGNTR